MKLSDFEVLSFDCYGTLIDWDSGISTALRPLTERAGGNSPLVDGERARVGMGLARSGMEMTRASVLQAFARLEARQQERTPDKPYPDVLAQVYTQLATEWDVEADPAEAAAFGRSIGDWPAFPDTIEALKYLKQHARLVILSNVDRASFQATNQRLGVAFDAIHTAQDIGSYKPDPRNFGYLLDRLREQGTGRDKLLHVAQSLFHDHAPAKALGLTTAWIDRRDDTDDQTAPGVRYDYRFTTLGELVEAHRLGQ